MRSVLIALVAVTLTSPVFARGGAVHGGAVHVRGYTTRNGTYVAPHYRSAPDHNPWNNWSTIGNVNPYTGKAGTKIPYRNTYSPYVYTVPSYTSEPRTYVPPSYSYGPGDSYTQSEPLGPPLPEAERRGAILLPSGVLKIPAKTKSGYCLETPENYVATGDLNYPVVTDAAPRCEQMAAAKRPQKGIVWLPLRSSDGDQR